MYARYKARLVSLSEVNFETIVLFDRLALTLQLSRAIDLEELKLLRVRLMECQRREEVNHPQRCRQEVEDYMKAFKKYRSEGHAVVEYLLSLIPRPFV